ncbi:MAG: hypothetical protein U9P70_03500 [Patescibacteria group bacterium]|nr:hypothetical protein [Patescibacteria group bacterium]
MKTEDIASGFLPEFIPVEAGAGMTVRWCMICRIGRFYIVVSVINLLLKNYQKVSDSSVYKIVPARRTQLSISCVKTLLVGSTLLSGAICSYDKPSISNR